MGLRLFDDGPVVFCHSTSSVANVNIPWRGVAQALITDSKPCLQKALQSRGALLKTTRPLSKATKTLG